MKMKKKRKGKLIIKQARFKVKKHSLQFIVFSVVKSLFILVLIILCTYFVLLLKYFTENSLSPSVLGWYVYTLVGCVPDIIIIDE